MNNRFLPPVEDALFRYLPSVTCREGRLAEAMRYSLAAGGKRVRPMLVMEFNALCGGRPEAALPFACAVEMIHTYSLIHDDLPCMDDDDLRRGKPSSHKVFGEDIALLAGDALLTLAFEILTDEQTVSLTGESACCRAVRTLARYAGGTGMVGGQVIDLQSENQQADEATLRDLVGKKTACLIQAACELGCLSAHAGEEQLRAAAAYGEGIGFAFQIQDDILDCTSTDAVLGKPVGSDEENQKSTFVSLLGLDRSRQLVDSYTEQAVDALRRFSGDTLPLEELAAELARRRS